jgi:hypothetical protein
MDREILGARAEIPPAAFLRNDATDPAASADPFGEDWNKGDFRVCWNALENLRVPDRNVGVVEITRMSVAISDVDDSTVAVAECDVGGQAVLRKARVTSFPLRNVPEQRLEWEIVRTSPL